MHLGENIIQLHNWQNTQHYAAYIENIKKGITFKHKTKTHGDSGI